MVQRRMIKFDKNKIKENNPKIDKSLIEKYESLENKLKNLGVDTKPKFSIEPPLGGNRLHLYNS